MSAKCLHSSGLAAERGDEVRLGVQQGSPDAALEGLDLERVRLDVLDRRALRRALKGIERVFHCAGVASQRWTYRSTKARRELGWRARGHEETLEATVAWHLEREHERIARTRRSRQLQYRVAGSAIGAAEEALGLARRILSRQALR